MSVSLDFTRMPIASRLRISRRAPVTVLLCAMATLFAGCVSAPTPRLDRTANLPPPSAHKTVEDDSKSLESAPVPKIPPTLNPGNGQMIDEHAASAPTAEGGGAGGEETTFNFEGTPVQVVIKAILGDLLHKNYVIAPGVQGSVTLATPSPVNSNQALSLLEMVLGWNNARMIWADGRYNIVPADQALASGNLGPHMGSPAKVHGYEVRAVPLRFISATEMEKLLKPYARTNAIVNVDSSRNLIVLAGTRDELDNYLRTVQIFDVDWLAGMSVGVFPLQQTDASHMVTELEKVFGEGSKTPVAGMFRFMPLEGINAVLVITPQSKYLGEIQSWIDRLDAGDGQTPRLYVYEVKNVKAADLSNQIGTLFGIQVQQQTPAPSTMPGLEPVELSSYGSKEGGQPSPPLAPIQKEPNNAAARNAAAANTKNGDGSGVSITSVEDSNSILVRATPAQWESIRRAIDRLDTMPLQVHIEAQVIEVTLNADLNYGVSWYLKNGISLFDGGSLLNASTGRTAVGPVGGTILPAGVSSPETPGLTEVYLAGDSLAVIQALDQVSHVRVLSAPSLVVRNNVEADFDSGTQIPIASTILSPGFGNATTTGSTTGSTTGTTTDSTDTFSQVQYIQTGISLKVKPRVASNGMVFMDITQDVSTPQSTVSVGGNVPIDDRKLKTSVAVQSGETVVLAGLIKETKGTSTSGVPYLDRIPVVGSIFGAKTLNNDREEVLVMITPTVIRDASDARKLTDEYSSRFRGMDPIKKPELIK